MLDSTPHDKHLLQTVLALPVPTVSNARILELRGYVPRAYAPWTENEERCLLLLLQTGLDVSDISLLLLRQQGGITARMRLLGHDPHDESPARTATPTAEQFIPAVLARLFKTEVFILTGPPERGLAGWLHRQRRRAGRPWTSTEDHCTYALHQRGWPTPRVAAQLERGLMEVQRRTHLLSQRDQPHDPNALFSAWPQNVAPGLEHHEQ